jgi:hypothetical protein
MRCSLSAEVTHAEQATVRSRHRPCDRSIVSYFMHCARKDTLRVGKPSEALLAWKHA